MEAALYACGKAKEINTRKAWLKLRKVITRQRRVRVLLSYVAAASAVLLVGWGLFVMFSRVQHAPVEMVANGNLQDEGQIVLTLSDGRQVVLSDSLGTLQEQNGTRIANKDHSLVYDAADHLVEVAYNTVSIPWGAEYKLVLADGSKVWLNAQSSVTYPVAFHGKTREIRLEGEAYFEVRRNEKVPFVVKTSKVDVKVLGTEFNVSAYEEEADFEVALLKGSVLLESSRLREPHSMKPGEMVYFKDGQYYSGLIQNPDYFKWKEGLICFQNEPISDIMDKLSLYFDVKIQHRNQAFLKERYTGKFRSKDGVEQVLKVLQMEHHFRYVKDNEQNVITIK